MSIIDVWRSLNRLKKKKRRLFINESHSLWWFSGCNIAFSENLLNILEVAFRCFDITNDATLLLAYILIYSIFFFTREFIIDLNNLSIDLYVYYIINRHNNKNDWSPIKKWNFTTMTIILNIVFSNYIIFTQSFSSHHYQFHFFFLVHNKLAVLRALPNRQQNASSARFHLAI